MQLTARPCQKPAGKRARALHFHLTTAVRAVDKEGGVAVKSATISRSLYLCPKLAQIWLGRLGLEADVPRAINLFLLKEPFGISLRIRLMLDPFGTNGTQVLNVRNL